MPNKYFLIFLFLIGSGLAAMVYQIVWIRLASLSMGATSLSLSIVIGTFFLGLGLGSFLSRYFNHQKRPILTTYALLEFIIGFSALLLLPILLNLDYLIANFAVFSEMAFLKFLVIGVLLLIPTTAMGATLPLISTLVIQESSTMGKRYAQIYSLNTFGAVSGALLCGFVLVPTIGLDGAVYSAVVINLLIAASAFLLSKNNPTLYTSSEQPSNSHTAPKPILTTQKTKALIVLFATGFVSIATEIGWSKFLIIFTGSTIYGFAMLIAIFLFAMASGSWVIRQYLDKIVQPTVWLSYALLLLSISLVVTYTGFSYVPLLQAFLNQENLGFETQNLIKYAVIFVLIFAPSFLFGVIFPLALLLYTQSPDKVQKDSSTAFGLNTIAGVLGAILAGMWIIPQFGTATLLLSMAAIIAITSLIFINFKPCQKQQKIRVALSLSTLIVIAWVPPLNYKHLLIETFNKINKSNLTEDQITYIKEAKSGVIGIVDLQNQYSGLINNGLSEASIDHFNPNKVDLSASLLALLPYLLHTDFNGDFNSHKSGFIVGFGGGISLDALTRTPIQSIKIVEIEPAVIEAMESIYPKGIPALLDKRVTLEIEDARHLLLAQKERYDMIISQPSHPWLSGASNLFTEEFFEITKNRLNENGIYSQWVNLFKMDATTLKAIIKAFNKVYPYTTSFVIRRNSDFILIGSKQPIQPTYQAVASRLSEPKIQEILSLHQISTPEDLAPYQGLNKYQMVNMTNDAVSSTQTNIITETRLSQLGWQIQLPEEQDPFNLLEKWYDTPAR